MPRPLRVVLVGFCYLMFGVTGVLLAYVLLPLRLLGIKGTEERAAAAQDLLYVWSRRYFLLTRALGIVRPHYPVALPLPERGRSAVIIANHPSLLDVVFAMGSMPRLTYVAKASWMSSPLVGRMLRACGHIGSPRVKTPADGAIALQRMIEALEKGRTLLVFPEGTRSPRRGMWPFHRGAFEAAIRTKSPIMQYVLEVDPPMLRKEQPWYDVADRCIEYRMRALETLDTTEIRSGKALLREIEARYLRELGLTATSEPQVEPVVEARA
jgi:1-acyl-sn-glycerol-3-phosphate acyltransferase